MQILLDNFIEAWINAIKYHDKIMEGYITLGIQKQFVSSLHNAVELCLKQLILDKNTAIPLNKSNENESKADEIISNIKQIKNDIVLKSKIEEFNQNNNNLNHFFAVLDSEKMKDIHTIGFKDLIGKSKELIGIDVKDTLKLLNELRNDETHFYIDNSFLSDENFCKLHNFMIIFYKLAVKAILIENRLLYNSDYIEEGLFYKYKDYFYDSEYKDNYDNKFTFERSELQIFTKEEFVSNHKLIEKIKEAYNKYYDKADRYDEVFKPESLHKYAYLFAACIEDCYYEDIYALLVSLKATKLIELEECMGTMTDEDGNEEEWSFGYAIKFNY